MTDVVLEVRAPGLRGSFTPPGDKSISHRVLLLALIAPGASELEGVSDADDVVRTRRLVEALGARCEARGSVLHVHGVGLAGLAEPEDVADLGNAGTGVRLGLGVAALLDGVVVFTGDASLRRRPMARVVEPLRTMGAWIDGRAGGDRLPVLVRGGGLRGRVHRLDVASAQVKGALLVAGLGAEGLTEIFEPSVSRRHTEELLVEAGIELHEDTDATGVHRVALWGPCQPKPLRLQVPGDPSAAAPLVAAAAAFPGAELEVGPMYLGRERTGFLQVLERMGAAIEVIGGSIRVHGRRLTATVVEPHEVPSLLDEVPALAVAFAQAEGTSAVTGAAELAVKESDRRVTTVGMVRAFGVEAGVRPDGLWVSGGPLNGERVVATAWDHRIVMAGAALGMLAGGRTVIEGADAVETSFPSFFAQLESLGEADIVREGQGGNHAARD